MRAHVHHREPVPRRSHQLANGGRPRGRRVTPSTGLEIRRLRTDAGLSIRALAAAAGLDHGHLARIETGRVEPGFAVLIAVGEVLGADLSVRLYPTTGPRIHDRIQAPTIEELFGILHPRWSRHAEVGVIRPARGFVDAVLALPADGVVIATEVESAIRRVEQQLRWAHDKADSLPSSSAWPIVAPVDGPQPRISRLLILRSTRSTREVARAFAATLAAEYPAPASAIHAALTTADAPWPGSGILWAAVAGGRARILDRPPRGVALGR
jgi:transcriptional regulator with XRE-family HTH domain